MASVRVEAIGNGREAVLFFDIFRAKTARRRERQLGTASGSSSDNLLMKPHDHEETTQLVRLRNLKSDLDRELQYRMDRHVGDLVLRGVGTGSS